ncbi:hypothetical protein B8W86_05865, partial [Lactobacillus kefiranofaciens]
WEQRKLGEVAQIVRGASPRPINNPKWFDSESNIGWLRISDVTSQKGKIYHLEQHISKLGQQKTRVVTTPHLLLSIAASVGYPVINYVPTGVHDGFIIFENLKLNIDFGFFWLQNFRPIWKKYGQPGSQVNLNRSIVSNTKICFPSNIEQRKIVDLLNQITKLQFLQQRKLKKIKLLKRAMLQNLFTCKSFPKVRFKGFLNAWEQRKLGEVAQIVRGASPRPINNPKWFDSESNIGWLRISDVTSQKGKIYHLEQHISKLGQQKTRVVTTPHLLLSIAASVGYPVINYVPTGVHDGFIIFENLKLNIDFGFFWLQNFRPIWKKYGQPGSQVNLNRSIVSNTKICFPSNIEQRKIVDLLNQITKLQFLQQQKVKELQQTKEFLLQNMFI